jgi:endonuclease YncB( thermonuclease family)
VLLVVALFLLLRWARPPQTPRVPRAIDPGPAQVARVIDGDTVVLDDGTRVRLIGVDTPELARDGRPAEPLADEATRFTRRFIDSASGRVRLERDGDLIDRYGRALAVAWVDQRMLNEALVLKGLARARTEFNYSEALKQRLRAAEAEAKAAGRGLWAGD